LDSQDQLNPARKGKKIRNKFLSGPFWIIKRDVAKYHAEDSQIIWMIREHHRHQREKHLERLSPDRHERVKKKLRRNTHASAVYYFFIFITLFIYFILYFILLCLFYFIIYLFFFDSFYFILIFILLSYLDYIIRKILI
jgi:hypothetical protein